MKKELIKNMEDKKESVDNDGLKKSIKKKLKALKGGKDVLK